MNELENIKFTINRSMSNCKTDIEQYLVLMQTIKFCQKRTFEIEKQILGVKHK